MREVAKPGEEHGEVSDFDLDISRSGSDRSMSPPEAEEFNVDREVEAEDQTQILELPDPEIQNEDRERGRRLTRGPPHDRNRRSNSSPHFRVQDIIRIDVGVDVIIQKLNLTTPNLREKTAVEKVMTKLEVIKVAGLSTHPL